MTTRDTESSASNGLSPALAPLKELVAALRSRHWNGCEMGNPKPCPEKNQNMRTWCDGCLIAALEVSALSPQPPTSEEQATMLALLDSYIKANVNAWWFTKIRKRLEVGSPQPPSEARK